MEALQNLIIKLVFSFPMCQAWLLCAAAVVLTTQAVPSNHAAWWAGALVVAAFTVTLLQMFSESIFSVGTTPLLLIVVAVAAGLAVWLVPRLGASPCYAIMPLVFLMLLDRAYGTAVHRVTIFCHWEIVPDELDGVRLTGGGLQMHLASSEARARLEEKGQDQVREVAIRTRYIWGRLQRVEIEAIDRGGLNSQARLFSWSDPEGQWRLNFLP